MEKIAFQDTEIDEDGLNLVKLTFLTKSGSIEAIIFADSEKEPEQIADEMRAELATRPQWMAFGNVVFFSGAVSAISVDIYDRAEAA